MKRLFQQTIKFFLILAGIVAGLECIIIFDGDKLNEPHLDRAHAQLQKDYCWVNNIHKNKVLLCGSSTIKYSMDCRLLNELNNDTLAFINLAHFSRGPIETYFILKSLDLSDTKELYLGIDPWIYVKNYYKNKNKALLVDFNSFEIIHYSYRNGNQLFFQRYLHYFKGLTGTETTNCSTAIPAEFGSATINKTPANFNELIYSWFEIENFGWSKLQFEYLKKIDTLCKKHNIKFTLIIPAKRNDFVQDYCTSCQSFHKEFITQLDELHLDSYIIGSFDELIEDDQDQYFIESYHMNETGQKAYSKVFQKYRNKKTSKINLNYNWIQQDCNNFNQH